ncbi:MAG TPA: hypothetical protein VGK73_17290 [Polyangiaceae bacterium]
MDIDPDRVRRVVLGLPEVALRVEWLRDYLASAPSERTALELERLCEASERSDPGARETVLSLALLLARFGDQTFVGRLRARAESEHLLSLGRLLRTAPSPLRSLPPPKEAPVPDYGAGRELTVGERRSLARAPTRRAFEKLLADPHPLVIRQLLENPRLTEDDVIRIATRRPVRPEAVTALARSERWLKRPRVRLAILLNPGSPPAVSMPLLAACTRSELLEILHGTDISIVLRATARELLARRPPLEEPDAADHVMLQ